MLYSESVLAQLCIGALESLDMGLVLFDNQQRVVIWNRWMEKASSLTAEQVRGKTLLECFPQLAGSRLQGAIAETLCKGFSAVLSSSLNRSPLPLRSQLAGNQESVQMQQNIRLSPLLAQKQGMQFCLMQVHDVTAVMKREQLLRLRADEFHTFAFQDALTGVSNRRYFEEQLNNQWRISRRTKSPLGLLLLDIDHFKLYNDLLGHQAGDECLRRAAQAMKHSLLRSEDVLVRYGGEEFAVLLPHTELSGCQQIAERIQGELARLDLKHPGAPLGRITCSIGIACLSSLPGQKAEELVQQADQALYRAKHAGRNCISL